MRAARHPGEGVIRAEFGLPKRRGQVLVIVTITFLIASCGGDKASRGDTGATTTASTPDTATTRVAVSEPTPTAGEAEAGECTIEITGDWDETWTFGQSIYSVSTDYWLSEEDLRGTVEFLGEEIAGGSYEEIVGRGEPIITFLSLGCQNADDLIAGAVITHTNTTRISDLPMAPGSYRIIGGLFDAAGPAGTMVADFSVSGDELYGTIPESGTVEITRWDRDGIEGSFSFAAKESFVDDPRQIEVLVSFSFECAGWHSGC